MYSTPEAGEGLQNGSSQQADDADVTWRRLCSACQEEPVPQANNVSNADTQPQKVLHILSMSAHDISLE